MVRATFAHVMCGPSGGSCKGGERTVLAGRGRARTCCCFSSSMSTWLTSLLQLGSVGRADLEHRQGHNGGGFEPRPPCGLDKY